MALLQLEAQTRVPDVIVVLENNQEKSGWWAVKDVATRLEMKGVELEHLHLPEPMEPPMYHLIALELLYSHDVDIFFKIDHDDFYYEDHIEKLEASLGDNDFVINTSAHALTLPFGDDFTFQVLPYFDANPLGGMSNASCFSRTYAERYIRDMAANKGKVDDVVMIEHTCPASKCKKVIMNPTTCYVMHGGNQSSSQSAILEWIRKNKEKAKEFLNL